MPFDEEDNEEVLPQKVSLKQVSTQKSMFDGMVKKPSVESLEKRAQQMHEKSSTYKVRAAELASQFNRAISDKTLKSNKNVFAQELEKELLSKMIQLAVEINNDVSEQEGMGSLSWITILLKTCFTQRDRINNLEYTLSLLEKKLEPAALSGLISLEIKRALDKPKKSE